MIKRLNCIEVVGFANYIVTMERLKNNVYGTPRYKSTIISKSVVSDGVQVYTFTGHYYSLRQEAEFILNEYLKGLEND